MRRKNKCIIGDIIWIAVFLMCVSIIAVPVSRAIFIEATESHPYVCGFFKFCILATMGDLLGLRITEKNWRLPDGVVLKACLWGIIGMIVTLLMPLYNGGVESVMKTGRLPFEGSGLALAFFSSAIMNLTFGPMLYIYHKFGEILIDARYEETEKKMTLGSIVEKVDWNVMVCFSWAKTCILIWIPLHTMVFLLPGQYRVVVSAFLSVLLGIVIAMSNKKHK